MLAIHVKVGVMRSLGLVNNRNFFEYGFSRQKYFFGGCP
jgi:hypothetical protein